MWLGRSETQNHRVLLQPYNIGRVRDSVSEALTRGGKREAVAAGPTATSTQKRWRPEVTIKANQVDYLNKSQSQKNALSTLTGKHRIYLKSQNSETIFSW